MSETPAIEVVLDAHATIGESPTWVAEERALYWIDVKRPALYRFDPASGANREWRLTSDIGGFALIEGGAALVALRHGLHRLDLASGALTPLAPPPFDPAMFRFNEGACDAEGRFWVGVMFDPLDGDAPARKGGLHSFTLAGGLRTEPDAAELHNGMAWSADGRRFFLSHSNSGAIVAFDREQPDRLGKRTLFATVVTADGIPDGAAIDTEGGYWCALHGGGRLRRYRGDGTVDRAVDIGRSPPPLCAFAGDDLATLYVTTASDNMNDEQHRREPHAGALLRLDVGARGIVRHYLVR